METYPKCDIIREGGQLCPLLSLRFPIYIWKQSFSETKDIDSEYNKSEAEALLKEKFRYYLEKLKREGYKIVEADLKISKSRDEYKASSDIIRIKRQNHYKNIKKIENKGMKPDGNNGNGN